MKLKAIFLATLLTSAFSIHSFADENGDMLARINAVNGRLTKINQRASLVSDINDVEFLQRAYGFYVDEMLWDQVIDLFTEDATLEIGTSGVFVGKKSIRHYLYSLTDGKQGPIAGRLNNYFQLQPVVHVAPDGLSAKGRWHTLIQTGIYGAGSGGQWGEGVYENEYIKEDGVWKIKELHLYINFIAPYEGGWKNASAALVDAYSKGKGVEPDKPTTDGYQPFPTVYTPPFHYETPAPQKANGDVIAGSATVNIDLDKTVTDLEAAMAKAELSVQRLQSIEELENIEGIYGYYVDRSQHDLLADLFAEDASLEILGRGVFIGQDRIRAYMHNLGPVGPQEGKLFTHMQFQPVTHLSEDGQTAHMRSRLLVMFGIQDDNAQWGEGIYENIFTREDGVWKIKKLHAFQVYYTYYEDGWAKKSSDIFAPFDRFPPDFPQSVDYDPYPAAYVPPFHYKNPVTGK